MRRRHFDDYDPNEWQEEHKKAEQEKRKRDAKKHRHELPVENEPRQRPH